MAQSFPKDRFDAVPSDLERVGAHRAPRRRGRGLLWLAWCALAIVVIVAAGWIYLRVLDGNLGVFHSSPAASASQPASATPKATPMKSSTPTPTVAPTVVPTTSITVLNGTTTSGLASGAVQTLASDGWTAASAQNANSHDATQTTVYYANAADKGIALGVAQSFPTARVIHSSVFASNGSTITIVLGSDYQP